MARTLISPGVSLNEIDLSNTPQTTTPVGAAFIGSSPNGPAFEPLIINSYDNEYKSIFGGLNKYHYLPYAVKNYLENGSNALVVRVAGFSSTVDSFDAGWVIPASGNWVNIIQSANGLSSTTAQAYASATSFPFAVLRKRNEASVSSVSAKCETINDELKWTVYVDAVPYQFTPSTIERYFTRDPYETPISPACSGLYLDILYYSQAKDNAADLIPTLSDPSFSSFTQIGLPPLSGTSLQGAYSCASTPWIVSAPNAAGTVSKLFKFHTLQSGSFANTQCKVSIDNIKRKLDTLGNAYFEFDVLVRKVNDTDKNGQVVYERFSSCNLIKTSQNYIVKKIGDLYKEFDQTYNSITINGDWPNNSNYIRVEVSNSISQESRPSGFEGLKSILGSTSMVAYPHRNLKINQISGSSKYNSKIFFGFEGDGIGCEAVTQPYVNGTITDRGILLYDRGGLGISSSADEIMGVTASTLSASYHILPIYPSESVMTGIFDGSGIKAGGLSFKFTVPFFGGHDGYRKSLNAQELITTLSAEYAAITELLKNADMYDFDTLVIPGTDATNPSHAYVVENGIDLCEERGDCFYIADLFEQTVDNPEEPNNETESFDTNYAATYWPWHQVWDPENKEYVWNPPSVLAIERYAYNDKVGWKWDAVAGYNVGIGKNVERLKYQLTQDQRDTLYENRINPIASFKDTPAILWGQKTLQKTATALDRINVRRLLIAAKRPIKIIGMRNLFKGSTPDIWKRTANQINTILTDMKTKNGIEEFGVIIDATTNTPDRRDRNEMYGKIYITPTKTIEKVYFDFIITNSGASFNGI